MLIYHQQCLRIPTLCRNKYFEQLHCFLDLLAGQSVDTEVLIQSVSDMLDVSFGESITAILQSCGDRFEPISGIGIHSET